MSIELPGQEPEQPSAAGTIQVVLTVDPGSGKIALQTNLQGNAMNALVITGILDRAKPLANQMAGPQRNIVVPEPKLNGGRF